MAEYNFNTTDRRSYLIHDVDWQDATEGLARYGTRMLAQMHLATSFGACGIHLTAYQVKLSSEPTSGHPDAPDSLGYQDIADEAWRTEWDGLCAIDGERGPFETVEIHGREYVVVGTPFVR